MAELFRVKFDVGGDAPVEIVASMFAGLDVVTQGALNLAAHVIDAAVDEGIRAYPGGTHERPPRPDEASQAQTGQMFAQEERVPAVSGIARQEQRQSAFPMPPPISAPTDPTQTKPIWQRTMLEQLYASKRAVEHVAERVQAERVQAERVRDELEEAARELGLPLQSENAAMQDARIRARTVLGLMPERPYRFRSVRYRNPLTVEIISEAGFAATSLAFVLRLVRDWSSVRRRLAAEAAAAESRAADTESGTLFLNEFRRLVLEQVARGELVLTSQALDALVSNEMATAVDRLARRKPIVTQRSLDG